MITKRQTSDVPEFKYGNRLKHPLYRTWTGMKQRCLNPNDGAYHYYGGAGITIHPSWMQFETFVSDMGPRPEGYTLDRINPNGNYQPDNCRWASKLEQANNTRRARGCIHFDHSWRVLITYLGKKYTKRFKYKQDAEAWLEVKRKELDR